MLNTQHSEFKSVKNADLAPAGPHRLTSQLLVTLRIFFGNCFAVLSCRPASCSITGVIT